MRAWRSSVGGLSTIDRYPSFLLIRLSITASPQLIRKWHGGFGTRELKSFRFLGQGYGSCYHPVRLRTVARRPAEEDRSHLHRFRRPLRKPNRPNLVRERSCSRP